MWRQDLLSARTRLEKVAFCFCTWTFWSDPTEAWQSVFYPSAAEDWAHSLILDQPQPQSLIPLCSSHHRKTTWEVKLLSLLRQHVSSAAARSDLHRHAEPRRGEGQEEDRRTGRRENRWTGRREDRWTGRREDRQEADSQEGRRAGCSQDSVHSLWDLPGRRQVRLSELRLKDEST